MFSILQTMNGILRGSTVNILGLNPDLRSIRVKARDFADEFWDDVIEDTGGDDSAMSALYATLALLVEKEKLYQVAFDLLYGYHLSRNTGTALPVLELDGNPRLISEFMKVFLLFSQIILEDYAEEIAEDVAADLFVGICTPGP